MVRQGCVQRKMLCSQIQVLLVALSASVLLARVSGAPHRDVLTELLRADATKGNEVSGRSMSGWVYCTLYVCQLFMAFYFIYDQVLENCAINENVTA